MELSRHDALNKAAILLLIGKREIVGKGSICGKRTEPPAAGFAGELSVHVQALSPIMRSGPEYGASAMPFDPKTRSETSNQPLVPNCVDEKLTCTLSG